MTNPFGNGELPKEWQIPVRSDNVDNVGASSRTGAQGNKHTG